MPRASILWRHWFGEMFPSNPRSLRCWNSPMTLKCGGILEWTEVICRCSLSFIETRIGTIYKSPGTRHYSQLFIRFFFAGTWNKLIEILSPHFPSGPAFGNEALAPDCQATVGLWYIFNAETFRAIVLSAQSKPFFWSEKTFLSGPALEVNFKKLKMTFSNKPVCQIAVES